MVLLMEKFCSYILYAWFTMQKKYCSVKSSNNKAILNGVNNKIGMIWTEFYETMGKLLPDV